MPIQGAKYRMKKTAKGNVRLAFKGGKVVETKNMKTGRMHTVAEFKADKKKSAKNKAKKSMKSLKK
jgi:hypothetical protein